MSANSDASQVHTLSADLARLGDRARTLSGAVVAKSAADLEKYAKAAAPVDTGNLRASIGTTMHDALTAEVGPTANYGAFLELGTSRMGPQPYMFPALDKVTPAFVAAMGKVADL